jgi:tetratricopeptide (TPR) repeat protein
LKGDREKALDVFLKATRMKPDAGEGFYFLSKTYREMGRIQEAIDAAENLITLQGVRADSDDLDRLHGSLDLYEVVVGEYEKDFKEVWMRNLRRLGRTEEELEKNGRMEEDSIPIIQIGGLEPVFVVEEEEESLSLEEEEEDDLSVEVSTDGHIPFQNLIDQEQSRLPPVRETPAPREPEAAGGIPFENPPIPPEFPPAGQPPPYVVVAPVAAPSSVSMPPPIVQSAPAPSMDSLAMSSLKNSIDTQRGMLEQVQQDLKDLTESLKQEESPENADGTAAEVSETEPGIANDNSEEAPELEPVEDEQDAASETASEAAEEPSMLEELDEEAAGPGLEISEEEPELLDELFGEEPESSMELFNDTDFFPIEELPAETQDQAVDSTAPETVIQEIKFDKMKTAGLLDYLVKLTDALPDSNHQSFLKSTIKSKTELIIADLLKKDRRGS